MEHYLVLKNNAGGLRWTKNRQTVALVQNLEPFQTSVMELFWGNDRFFIKKLFISCFTIAYSLKRIIYNMFIMLKSEKKEVAFWQWWWENCQCSFYFKTSYYKKHRKINKKLYNYKKTRKTNKKII